MVYRKLSWQLPHSTPRRPRYRKGELHQDLKCNVLDLFVGMGGWTQADRERGHHVIGLDLNPDNEPRIQPDIRMDIREFAQNPERYLDNLVEPGWRPHVVKMSSPCEGFCVPKIGANWVEGTWPPEPKTDVARYSVECMDAGFAVIERLRPRYWWAENPRAMMRKMPQVQKYQRVTVSYCQYDTPGEDPAQKMTDLWGVWPDTWMPRPMCSADRRKYGYAYVYANGTHEAFPLGTTLKAKRGEVYVVLPDGTEFKAEHPVYTMDEEGPCHVASPRGAKTGTQGKASSADRALVPYGLSLDTCIAYEQAFAKEVVKT